MNQFVGGIYVLATLPIWATAGILFTIVLLALPVGREITEGLPYNISCSSSIGDVGLIVVTLIAATILHRGAHVPEWLQSDSVHLIILCVIMMFGGFGCALTLKSRGGKVMDIYHDIIIFPLLTYLVITLVPIIFINGTKIEVAATVGFILFWFGLVPFDVRHKRINQREWLEDHGVIFKNPKQSLFR